MTHIPYLCRQAGQTCTNPTTFGLFSAIFRVINKISTVHEHAPSCKLELAEVNGYAATSSCEPAC